MYWKDKMRIRSWILELLQLNLIYNHCFSCCIILLLSIIDYLIFVAYDKLRRTSTYRCNKRRRHGVYTCYLSEYLIQIRNLLAWIFKIHNDSTMCLNLYLAEMSVIFTPLCAMGCCQLKFKLDFKSHAIRKSKYKRY